MGHSVWFLLLLILSYDICCNSEDPSDGFLMFSKVRTIESINVIDEEDPVSPVYTITNNKYIRAVAALAFDYVGERLFFSDERKQNILSTFLNGTNIKVVVKDIGQVHGLAYERSGGDIYFTSSTESRISKINVNIALNDVTTKPEVLIQQPEEERPRAIVIEHCEKYMYWVTWSIYRPSIQRARLTGKNIQIVINTDILSPQGLTIDHTTNILYWSDATLDKIEKCDLDGSNRKIISSVRQQSFGLAVLGKYLYWTDWLMNAVIRINKFDGSDFTRIRDNLFVNPRGIIAIHRDSNTCIIDKCKEGNHECQDVCVIDTNGNVYCQCTYGILDTDGKTCKIVTQIIKPPEDQRIVKGSTAIFYCGVSQYAKVKVTWKWTYRKLQWNRDDQIFNDYRRSISVDGTLTIKGVKFFDIGEYTCTVTSIGGNDKRSASLTVIEFPLSPIISIATLYPFDERAAFVKWVQGFDGNSPITRFIIEYREVSNDNEHKGWVTFKSNIQPDIREAIITDLRPARNYQFRVTASNEVGNGSPSMPQPIPPLAIPQLPPSCSPKDFYGIASSKTTIRLAWIPPDEDSWNGPLFGYFIKYKLAGSPDSTFQQKLVPVSNSYPYQQYELQGLAIYKTYDIQIAAFNGKGAGVYSIIKVATSEGLPTASPKDLRVRVLNSTAVNVSWTPPNQEYIHGKNLGYKVLALKLDKKPTQSEMIVPHDPSNPIGTQHAILHNLKPFTVYEISVLCYTGQGDGPQSNTKAVKTAEDLPSQIEWLGIGEVTEESVTINWKPPIERNGIIIGYTLLYWRKKDNRTRERIYLPSSAHTNTLSNLSSMTIYTVSMFASTSVGNGPSQSIDVESWIPPGFPLPPSSLAVSLVDTRSAELLFIPGSDGGNPLSSFHVEALEGNVSAEWKTIYTQTIDCLAAPVLKVENLKPFTDYKLRITAENAAGQSFPSGSTRPFKTLQDVPENPPGDITVRALNATALRITWKVN
ncbi:protein sidekick-like [Ruditapes philippinarum]|uniref:protein sidekick-like n=1 Tax=Ruditapes philippinarum TaxID=129788 RepID=UPI00295B1111|nr:protein sidekick-like [Ruditapes philippinarum]